MVKGSTGTWNYEDLVTKLETNYSVRLFKEKTGLSVHWLATNLEVELFEGDPEQRLCSWPAQDNEDATFLTLIESAAPSVLWWRNALSDVAFLTDRQKDSLGLRNLRENQNAKLEIERMCGGKKKAVHNHELQIATKKHIAQKISKNPNLSRAEIYALANEFIGKRGPTQRSEATLRIWLLDQLPEGKRGPKKG